MRYLLDTHAIIWNLEDSPRLPPSTQKMIDADDSRLYISSASLWEIAIKVNLGKLQLNTTFDEFLDKVRSSDIKILQIKNAYLKRLATLPLIHKDPFDRLLISTALALKLTIITADENIRKYDLPWIW
jgi:PIN domain nuclease of toxin-antitoxin system